ncbi:MAG: hypothetical protein AAB627_00135 [Patescibacteria group bacterium]
MKKKLKGDNLKRFGLISLVIISLIAINDQLEEYGYAQIINLPGRTIDLNKTGTGTDVNIQYPTGSGIKVQQPTGPTGTTNIITPGRTTTIFPGGVQTSTGILKVEVSGKQVQINTNQDLETYKDLVLEQCSGVRTISTPGTTVQINYNQPARFLGIFRTDLDGEVEVSAGGDVKIKLPWYKFLFKKNSKEIEAKIENDLRGSQLSVTSPGASVQIQRQAQTISVVTSAVSVYTTPCGTTVTKTSPSPTPRPTSIPPPGPTSGVTQTPQTGQACSVPSNFPFSNYSLARDLDFGVAYGTVIASGIDTDDSTTITLAIARVLDLGEDARISTAYVFDRVDGPESARIDTLYIYAGALFDFRGQVGRRVSLNKADTVRKAMVAVNLLGSACDY